MPYVLLLLVVAAIVFLPQWWATTVLRRYQRVSAQETGAACARRLLSFLGLSQVVVEETQQGDHYDPQTKHVRLSTDNFHGRSLTAVVVAAHEVGHALQDATGYTPLITRGRLVRAAQYTDKIASTAFLAMPFVASVSPRLTLMLLVGGLVGLALTSVVHLVTLPVEWDASFQRALPLLHATGTLPPREVAAARRILRACALTYLAASLMSLFNLWRWLAVLRRR